MALHYVLVILNIAVGLHRMASAGPPFVTFSEFNELEDLRTFDFPDEGFTTDSVSHMTAEVVENGHPGSKYNQCTADNILVPGSLNCLAGFWKFKATLATLTYGKWIEPSSQRSECDYSVAFKECATQAHSAANQIVTMNANSIVDGNSETVWAHPITEGSDTKIKINLHGTYTVVALSLKVETVPLELSIGLSTGSGPIRNLVKLQQNECNSESDPICQQYLSMNRNNLTISWDFQSENEITGDHLHITLHGVAQAGEYSTNYYIIRDVTLLAKEVVMEPQPAIRGRVKSLRQILTEYHQYYNNRQSRRS